MTNPILRTNGEPFATEANAKGARTRLGLNDTHNVVSIDGGWALFEKQSDARVTLKPGDYIATKDLTEDDYHSVAREFIAAGADENEYDKDDIMPDCWDLFGWDEDDGLAHWDSPNSFEGSPRQLTLSQILSATNAGNTTQRNEEKTMHLTDLLFQARKERDEAQARYEQVLADHRATYPWLVVEEREPQPSEDMTDPANWRAGDVVECVDPEKTNESPYFTKGKRYEICYTDGSGTFRYIDDEGEELWACNEGFRFVRRP